MHNTLVLLAAGFLIGAIHGIASAQHDSPSGFTRSTERQWRTVCDVVAGHRLL